MADDEEREPEMTPEERTAAFRARMDGNYEPPILHEPYAVTDVDPDADPLSTDLTGIAAMLSGGYADAKAELAAGDALDAAMIGDFGATLRQHFADADYALIERLPEPAQRKAQPDYTIDKLSIVDTIIDSDPAYVRGIAEFIREGMS